MNQPPNMDCNLSLPYPPVAVEQPNPNYARVLLPIYAGQLSELTAISQYIYQSILLQNDYSDVAEIIECISMTEMKHFKMLGELILLLGADPRLRTSGSMRQSYWSGEYVDYSRSLHRMIPQNIQGERKAIMAYKNAIHQIQDSAINALLERIILDEEHHIEIFNSILQQER